MVLGLIKKSQKFMAPEHIYLLINKKLTGEISARELEVLKQWMRDSDENRLQVLELSRIWDNGGKIKLDLDLDTHSAWENIALRIGHPSKQRFFTAWSSYIRVAASILLLLSLGVLFYLFAPASEIEYQTGIDERMLIVLPDSSKVWLNEQSTLTFNDDFNNERALSLKGEAFFEVTHDPESPFEVESASMITTVLGTSFNINDYGKNSVSEVGVSTGKVQVATIDSNPDRVILPPGFKVTYSKESKQLLKSGNDNVNFLAWKERRLLFKNSTFPEIEKVLEDYFNIEISFDKGKLGGCQFTSSFEDPTLDEVLEILGATLDITYTKSGEHYNLKGDGCDN